MNRLGLKFKIFSFGLFLIVAAAAGLTLLAVSLSVNAFRQNQRDIVRWRDVNSIKQALNSYRSGSVNGFPLSSGECLSGESGVGAELIESGAIKDLPLDPLWAELPPKSTASGLAAEPAENFCYYYFSPDGGSFVVSYYLEANAVTGSSGRQTIAQ